jgi:murein DD-endopeptidase MepM/ murein hydrolase activator NlpD
MLRLHRRSQAHGLKILSCVSLLAAALITGCLSTGYRDGVIYQVKVENGDTLASLSRQFDADWKTIARMNGLSGKNPLRVGQVLRIAAGPSVGDLKVGLSLSDPSGRRSSGRTANLKSRDSREEESPIEQPASPDPVDEKTWQEEDLNAPRKTPGGSARDEEETRASRGLIGEPAQNFVVRWPAVGDVSSNYGPRWGRFHNGIDIRAAKGSRIVAAAEGRVIFVGRLNGYGKTVIVDHGQYRSLYGHCGKIVAKRGTWVKPGDHIAHVGISGNSRGAHLHFELRTRRDQPVDPIPFMEAKFLSSSSRKFRKRGGERTGVRSAATAH